MTQDAASKEQGVAWRGRVAKTFIEAVTQAPDISRSWLPLVVQFFIVKAWQPWRFPIHGTSKSFARYVASEATRLPCTEW